MVYTFECEKCGNNFEKEMSFAEYDAYKKETTPVICECGSKSKRTFIMNSLMTEFKGNGYYVTDYGKGRFDCR